MTEGILMQSSTFAEFVELSPIDSFVQRLADLCPFKMLKFVDKIVIDTFSAVDDE